MEVLTLCLQSVTLLARFRPSKKGFESLPDEKETILRSHTDTVTLFLEVVHEETLELAEHVILEDKLAAENDVARKVLDDMEIADECRHLGIRRPPHF